jgi:hypothetical protein
MRPPLVVDTLKRLATLPSLTGREQSVAEKLGYLATTSLRSDGRKATRADKLGDAVAAHPALCAAASGPLRGVFWELLQTAARDEATFTHDFWMSQHSTAQLKLRLGCEDFWWRLNSETLAKCGSRQAVTLLHRRVALGAEKILPPPGQRIWDILLAAVARKAPKCNPQFVTSALWACGKAAALRWLVAEQPSTEMSTALAAVLNVLPEHTRRMNAREVATSWWGLSELSVPLNSSTVSALNAAVVRRAANMHGGELAMTVRAYARMHVRLEGSVRRVLLKEIWRRAPKMSPQAVANSVWALGKAGGELPEAVHDALVAALQRTVVAMSRTELHSAVAGLACMQRGSPMPGSLCLTVVAVFESAAAGMESGQRAAVIRQLEWLGWVWSEEGGGSRSWFGGLNQWLPAQECISEMVGLPC